MRYGDAPSKGNLNGMRLRSIGLPIRFDGRIANLIDAIARFGTAERPTHGILGSQIAEGGKEGIEGGDRLDDIARCRGSVVIVIGVFVVCLEEVMRD
jgi:hypothetical protein